MKQYIILGASLLSLLAAGCSNEDFIENDTNPIAGKTIALNATISQGVDTRMSYEFSDTEGLKFAWSTQEKFNLYQGTSSTAAEFKKNAEGNTFTGVVPAGTGTYYAVYGDNITNGNGKLTVDISSQTGTIDENGITTFMVAETDDLTQALSFSHELAVLKLNLEFPDDVSGTTSKVTVMGFHNKATYTLADGGSYAYATADMGDITATNGSDGFTIGSDHKITAYVAVFPESVYQCNATIKVEVGGDTFLYSIQTTRDFAAGKVVPVNVKMIKLVYVDLGLSVKWANMNVGANTPEQYGGRYAWGETVNKENCSWDTYMCTSGSDCGGDNDPLKDYVNPNNTSISGTDYDVARVKWGGKWKMPTEEQLAELYNTSNCSRTWTNNYKEDGTNIAGWIFTSKKTNNSIFLPAAGFRNGSSLNNEGSYGYYWSAMPGGDYAGNACHLCFSLGGISSLGNPRYYGFSVRPVYVPATTSTTKDYETTDDSDFYN